MNHEVPINTLQPGARFRSRGYRPQDDKTGTLVRLSQSRALVKLDGEPKQKEFVDGKTGRIVTFTASRDKLVYWQTEAPVEPL